MVQCAPNLLPALRIVQYACPWLVSAILMGCSVTPEEGADRLPQIAKQRVATQNAVLPVDAQTVKGGAARAQRDAEAQMQPDVVRWSRHPWIAAAPKPLREEQRLPDQFYQPFTLNYSLDNAGMSLDNLALRLSQVSRLPVRVLPDVYTSIQDSSVIDESEAIELEERLTEEERKLQNASGKKLVRRPVKRYEVLEIPPHLLRWRGDLRGFLNHLTDRLDMSWSFDEGTIVFSRFQTESFELALFPVRGSYGMQSSSRGTAGGSRAGGSSGTSSGGSSAGGGTSGAAASTGSVSGSLGLSYSEEGQMDAYDTTIQLIENLIATVPGSKMYVTQGSGRIMVRSSRLMLKAIRDLIRTENSSLTRQVLVQLDIYSVTNSSKRQFGLDWAAIHQKLFPGLDMGFNFSGAVGALGVINLPDTRLDSLPNPLPSTVINGAPRNVQAVVTSFSQLGYGVQHRPLNMLAMNRQWVRKSRLLSQSYLAETIPASTSPLGGGAGVPGLRAGAVTVGDQIMVMPFVLENNSVLLKLGLSFSDLLGLERVETGEGATRQLLQIPTTSTSQDNLTVHLKPGEVVAITGLGNHLNSSGSRTIAPGASVLLGGNETGEQKEQHFLVFVRVVLF